MSNRCNRIIVSILITIIILADFAAVESKTFSALPNFHKVAEGIYRGGAPTKEGLKKLKQMGIHTIIDLRISPKLVKIEKKRAQSMGMNWINIPMGRKAPTKKQVGLFLSTLAKAPAKEVFVHCQHGADRTGCMIGIYRVKVQKWDFLTTWKEMRKYGFKTYLPELKAAVKSRVQKAPAQLQNKQSYRAKTETSASTVLETLQ